MDFKGLLDRVVALERDKHYYTEKDLGFVTTAAENLPVIMSFRDSASHDVRERVLAGRPEINDSFVINPFKFTYLGMPNNVSRSAGWQIQCIDKTTPMKDVIMPDKIFGIDVVFGVGCFDGCYNVASVAHVPESIYHSPENGYSLFGNSGIREVPAELLEGNITDRTVVAKFCSNAYAINNIEKLNDAIYETTFYPTTTIGLSNFDIYNYYRDLSKVVSTEKKSILSSMKSEFPPYKIMQKASLYLEPVSSKRKNNMVINDVYIAHTYDNELIIFNPFIKEKGTNLITCPIETVAIKFDNFAADFQRANNYRAVLYDFKTLNADNFCEAISEIYNISMDELQKLADSEFAKIVETQTQEIEKANTAQNGLDYEPKERDYHFSVLEYGLEHLL